MIRRITAMALALAFVPFASALADDVGADEMIQIEQQTATPMPPEEEAVTAPPPPWVELQATAIGAGIGARFGEGVLLVEGREHPFKVRGLSVGDVGVARLEAAGPVQNLTDVSDLSGTYVAVGAGAAAGRGVSTVAMRNEKGVVIHLRSQVDGVQLQLGAEGLALEIE